jgi:hypothetical protein
MLVQYADFVDAAHNAAHLRDRCPGKLVVRIERFQPALNIERLDVFRDFVAPAGDEVVADDVLGNRCVAVVLSDFGRTASAPKSALR